MAAFRAELQKAHRRHDLALCLLIPGIVVLWVGGLAPADPEELANGYSALLYSLPVIEAILMPVMMAVLASRLWDMEIKGNTAKLLYTLQSRRSLFAGKAVFGVLEVLLVTVLELACVPVLGRVLLAAEALLQPYLEEARNKQNVEDIYMLLTDVPKEESVVISDGRYASEVLSDGFETQPAEDGSFTLPGVVSRKKQFIPALMTAYQEL